MQPWVRLAHQAASSRSSAQQAGLLNASSASPSDWPSHHLLQGQEQGQAQTRNQLQLQRPHSHTLAATALHMGSLTPMTARFCARLGFAASASLSSPTATNGATASTIPVAAPAHLLPLSRTRAPSSMRSHSLGTQLQQQRTFFMRVRPPNFLTNFWRDFKDPEQAATSTAIAANVISYILTHSNRSLYMQLVQNNYMMAVKV